MSAVQPGDVFTAEDGTLFVVTSTAPGENIYYRLAALGTSTLKEWSGRIFVGTGDRDSFDPCLGVYGRGQRYLGHRDHVGRLQGVDL